MAMRATSLHFVSALVAASVACSGNNGGSAGSNFTAGSGSIGGDSPVAGGQGGKSSSTPPSQCNPGADATWIEELPDGARFDAETATVSWTPTLSQAGLYTLAVAVPQGETGKLKIGVADAFDDPSNVPVVDPSAYQEEYGLPVLHLTVPSTIEENAIDPTTGNKAWVP